MNKNFKKVCLLSLVLIIISIIVITLRGRTYTVTFSLNNHADYELEIDNKDGEVTIINEQIINNEYFVKVKAKKNGVVYLYLNNGDYRIGSILYIHKNMVITDNNYFGRSTSSEIIPISISILLGYILYLLIKKYKHSKYENLYQYKNIAYLGIIIFLLFAFINNSISIFNYQGLYATINNLINSTSMVSFILFPLALITFTLVTISNIKLIIKEGKSFKNLLGLFLGIFICIMTLLPDYVYNILLKSQRINIYNLNSIGPYLYNFIESLIYLIIAYLECILIGTIIIAIKAVKQKVKDNIDYIIILGCQIKKDGTLTPLLQSRVDAAIAFRNNQIKTIGQDVIFIPSGGKGKDEIISESLAMKNYLITNGIKEKNIIMEDKSKNTYENIKFSNKLIKEKDKNILISTTNYHVLRAGLIATELGLKVSGIGAKTKSYFWINAFIREFIGTLYSEKKKHILVFITITILLITMISITYIANNL